MHLEPTGRAQEVVQVYDVKTCAGCGHDLTRVGTHRPLYRNCGVPTHRGHWILECKTCGGLNPDSVCDQPRQHHPLEGHRPHTWDDVQHGPSRSYGDDTMTS